MDGEMMKAISLGHVIRRLLAGIFLLAIAVPFIGNYLWHGSTPDKILTTENRRVTPYRELHSLRNGDLYDYYGNLDRYIADRLLNKDGVVVKANRFFGDPHYFFKLDLENNVAGKDGFVFIGDRFGKVLSRHFDGSFRVGAEPVARLILQQRRLKQAAAESGAAYMLFVAPDKHGVYCEYAPDWLLGADACSNGDRVTREVLAQLEQDGIHAVYPFDELRQAAAEHVYYKTDTHWNLKGAEIGFRALADALMQAYPQFASLNIVIPELISKETHAAGDINGVMGVSSDFKVDDVSYSLAAPPDEIAFSEMSGEFRRMNFADVSIKGWQNGWTGEVRNPAGANDTKVMVICDSFSQALSWYLTVNFKDVIYVARQCDDHVLESMIRSAQPNLVIFENVERDFPR